MLCVEEIPCWMNSPPTVTSYVLPPSIKIAVYPSCFHVPLFDEGFDVIDVTVSKTCLSASSRSAVSNVPVIEMANVVPFAWIVFDLDVDSFFEKSNVDANFTLTRFSAIFRKRFGVTQSFSLKDFWSTSSKSVSGWCELIVRRITAYCW